MLILGIGTDLTDIPRIAGCLKNWGSRFLNRVFTPVEQHYSVRTSSPAHALAKRFAAKEAFVKALGLGFRQGISFQEIQVNNNEQGKPYLTLTGKAHTALETLALSASCTPAAIHLSLSDTPTHALAFVIIEGRSL